jgi:transglutaminase superfamily protein
MLRTFALVSGALLRLPLVAFRNTCGPKRIVRMCRWVGTKSPRRTEAELVRVRRIIRFLDRLMPGEPNCFRRSLLEISLDQEMASQPLWLGIVRGGGPRSGHAWLAYQKGNDAEYDVIFQL